VTSANRSSVLVSIFTDAKRAGLSCGFDLAGKTATPPPALPGPHSGDRQHTLAA
jgi:hypothetical protein